MIKNRTYYTGKPFLKFERFPYYTDGTELNKVHIDFKFCKLVSRISMKEQNEKLLREIGEAQGCELMIYDISPTSGDISYHKYSSKGTPCFVKNGIWLSIDAVFMCHNRNMVIDNHGLAKIFEPDAFGANRHVGYYGFSHRGGTSFRVGDVIFDAEWQMDEFHKDFKKYKRKLNESKTSSRIEDVIPFHERGDKKIKTLEEAKNAALILSDELS